MDILKNKTLLAFILFGAILRLLWLSEIPSGFFRDETALGYNAYSIWKTGKDEFGVSYPIVFRSFEVFFLPAYVYLSAPIVGIFGLNEFATRFLSALSGVFALLLIYLIVEKIWNKKAGLFSVFILAISPWHIIFSRGTFEGNLALTFFAAGFLFFLDFAEKVTKKAFFISVLFFVLSIYSYQAERIVVPLFAAGSLFVIGKLVFNNLKTLLFPSLVGLFLLIPLLTITFKAAGIHRATGVSLFNKEPEGYTSQIKEGVITNNKYFLRVNQVFSLYASYFSPRNLFNMGDSNRERSTEHFSVFYPFLFPAFLAGLWLLIKRNNMNDRLLFLWVLAAPIPAALTGDPFHTYRSLLLYFPLTILAAIGANSLYETFKKSKIIVVLLSFLVLISFSFFIYDYAIVTQGTRARDRDFGYRDIVNFTKNSSQKVVVYDKWTAPYINFLFFEKTDPEIYHSQVLGLRGNLDFYYEDSSKIRPVGFSKYEFRKVDWAKERGDTGTTFVISSDELPESEFRGDPKVELVKEIFYPDGKSAYRVVKIK